MSDSLSTDVLIVGGGVAGLWLNARLRRLGYSTLLLDKGVLGGGQSVKSQGIIHGGTKYALSGALTGASEAIADMPRRWREALAGNGELDLSGVRLLSDAHYLWSPGTLTGNLTSFSPARRSGRVSARSRAVSCPRRSRIRVSKARSTASANWYWTCPA